MGMRGGGEHAYSYRPLQCSSDGMAIGSIAILLYNYIIVVLASKMGGNEARTADSERT